MGIVHFFKSQFSQLLKGVENYLAQILIQTGASYYGSVAALPKALFSEKLQPPLKVPTKPRWLVVGREYYSEYVRFYSMAKKREVIQAIQLEFESIDCSALFYQIVKVSEGEFKAGIWVISKEVVENLETSPWLLVPESYFLTSDIELERTCVEIELVGRTVFLFKNGLLTRSLIKNSLVNSLEKFAYSCAQPLPDAAPLTLTKKTDRRLLLAMVKALPLFWFSSSRDQKKAINYPRLATGAMVLVACYLVISSLLLLGINSYYDTRMESQKESVAVAAQQRSNLLGLQRSYSELSAPFKEAECFWQLFFPLLSVEQLPSTVVTSVTYQDYKVTFSGEAMEASSVLQLLVESPGVSEAGFTRPIQQIRQKQSFTIGFELEPLCQEVL